MMILKNSDLCQNRQSSTVKNRSRSQRDSTVKFTTLISELIGWLVVLGLTALWDNISVYIGPSPKEREREEKG